MSVIDIHIQAKALPCPNFSSAFLSFKGSFVDRGKTTYLKGKEIVIFVYYGLND